LDDDQEWSRRVLVVDESGTDGGRDHVGGATITAGDAVVLDVDGAVVVPRARASEVLEEAAGRRGARQAGATGGLHRWSALRVERLATGSVPGGARRHAVRELGPLAAKS
jgi:hypothetical protein